MTLYQKLKDNKLVDNLKEFQELIMIRAIKISDKHVDDPNYILNKDDKNIKVGIFQIED